MIDIHSHFLPEIDDGADSVECSLQMLEDLKQQGVSVVVSTSHYYENQGSVQHFLANREVAYSKLMNGIKQNPGDYPNIVLGAEVALTPGIPQNADLEKLCIGDTNTILIELPYNGYYEWIPYAIYEIVSRRNLVPILAHFERFCTSKQKFEQFATILDLDVKVQINTESLLYRKPYKVVKKLVKMDKFDYIGSDAHNMTTRKSTFAKGIMRIEKKFGRDYLNTLNNNAEKLIGLI